VAQDQARRRLALATLFGVAAVALGFAALFASSITAPIRKLADAADRMASGDLQVEPVVASTGDEVEVLTRSFTVMSGNLHRLVEDLREKAKLERLLHDETLSRVSMEMALREAQFMNLQDQVRPHFLFNALNTISRSALFEGAAATEALARTLGKLMRYSLAEGGPFTTLGEELSVLRDYLSFQAIRFGARLTWEVRAEPGIEAAALPRFTLQPLVENAVRHGIEPKEEGGRVIVSARRVRAGIRVVVADSGVGMAPDLLARLRAAAASRPGGPGAGRPGPGIGIANLVSRLENRYRGEARIVIASRPGRGTIMRISLPALARSGAAHAV
jgi:sensor histidine kinase YesM